RADESDHAERLAIALLVDERLGQHHDGAEYDQHQLGEKPNVIGGCKLGNHRPITCADKFAAVFRIDCTEPSMARVQRIGATPMINAAAAKGHRMARSRPLMSGSVRFTSCLNSP